MLTHSELTAIRNATGKAQLLLLAAAYKRTGNAVMAARYESEARNAK